MYEQTNDLFDFFNKQTLIYWDSKDILPHDRLLLNAPVVLVLFKSSRHPHTPPSSPMSTAEKATCRYPSF